MVKLQRVQTIHPNYISWLPLLGSLHAPFLTLGDQVGIKWCSDPEQVEWKKGELILHKEASDHWSIYRIQNVDPSFLQVTHLQTGGIASIPLPEVAGRIVGLKKQNDEEAEAILYNALDFWIADLSSQALPSSSPLRKNFFLRTARFLSFIRRVTL